MAVCVLGVINTTPDSFSDGDRFSTLEAARERATELAHQGADIIDVGGESTRPGAIEVGVAEEQRRVIPVVRELIAAGLTVSIDTIRAATAEAAVLAGARYINDVSGGTHDDRMLDTVARLTANIDGVFYIIGHWRGIPDPKNQRSDYSDVVHDIRDDLEKLCLEAIHAGVPATNIIVDPGLGFDKTAEQCWEILRRIDEIASLGYPVLIGASRKRMLASIADNATSLDARDLATSVVSALAARAGIWGVRVHDVLGTTQALAVEKAWGDPQTEQRMPPTPNPPVITESPSPNRLDTITLTGLAAFAHHGVFEFEREKGQPFVIDVSVSVAAAGTADNIENTVHYGELAEAVVQSVESDPVDLIETVAARVASVALNFRGVVNTTVTVHKPQAPIEVPFGDVAVTIYRESAS